MSDLCYRQIAAHRPGFDRLTFLLWGAHLVPPGETLTAWIFLRVLGVTYLIAFVSLWPQIIGLVGHDGILPVQPALESFRQHTGPLRYWMLPTLAWWNASDGALQALCAAGSLMSVLLIAGIAPVASLAGCWLLYLSLVTVGQDFLSFQWDALLLETGFLAMFLAPWRAWSRPRRDPPPSRLALWLLRWLLFRLMFSSALVKLASGDPVWRDLTALQYHYQTQCLPPWTAWYRASAPARVPAALGRGDVRDRGAGAVPDRGATAAPVRGRCGDGRSPAAHRADRELRLLQPAGAGAVSAPARRRCLAAALAPDHRAHRRGRRR